VQKLVFLTNHLTGAKTGLSSQSFKTGAKKLVFLTNHLTGAKTGLSNQSLKTGAKNWSF